MDQGDVGIEVRLDFVLAIAVVLSALEVFLVVTDVVVEIECTVIVVAGTLLVPGVGEGVALSPSFPPIKLKVCNCYVIPPSASSDQTKIKSTHHK